MKLRNKLSIITGAAALAFAGVGFGAWVFQNEVATTDVNGTPLLTCAVELNNDFKLYEAGESEPLSGLYLICDAPATGGHATVMAGEGVYWSTANDHTAAANKIANVYIKGTLEYDANDIDDLTSVTVTFTDNCTLTAGTYVQFAAATLPAAVTVTGDDLVDGAEVQSADFALPVPSYKEAINTIDTVAKVNTVTAGLANLKVGYKAKITAKA